MQLHHNGLLFVAKCSLYYTVLETLQDTVLSRCLYNGPGMKMESFKKNVLVESTTYVQCME